MRRILRSARGAFDLPSILVGVVVVGVLTAGVLAAVFGVIPFAQDNGAKQDLSAINTAQGVHKATKGKFVDDVSLKAAELVGELPAEMTVAATDGGGKYCASTQSKTGRFFTISSENTTPREGTCDVSAAAPDEFSAEPVLMTRRTPAVSGTLPNPWIGLDSSADGKYMIGAIANNYLFTSSDAGVNWTEHTEIPRNGDTSWSDMAVSGDGSRMYAATFTNDFYRSLDFGVTWQHLTMPVPDGYGFSSIATSANGMTILAGNRGGTAHAPDGGYMYLSKNGGDTWSRVNYPSWNGRNNVSVSADGMTLTGSYGAEFLVSTNGGNTWTTRSVPGIYRAESVESTTNGDKLILADEGGEPYLSPLPKGQLLTSTDKGATWTKSGPFGFWKNMSMSADGSTIVLANYAGFVTVSVDSGATWTELKSLGSTQWITVTVSADGSTFAAGTGSGAIYTGKLKG